MTTSPPYADPDLSVPAYRHPRHIATVTDGPPPTPTTAQITRRRRHALGLRQRDLAARLGVHPRQVSRWERGLDPVPVRILARLTTWSTR